MEKSLVLEEVPQLAWERSEGFKDILDQLTIQAQRDSLPKDYERLQKGEAVGLSSILANQKPFISESGVLMIQGKYSSADTYRFLVYLPKGHPLTKLWVRHTHEKTLSHVGSTQWLMAEVKKTVWTPHLRKLVNVVLSSCVHCASRYPRRFKQPFTPVYYTRMPGQVGEGQSPFSFTSTTSIDFFGPFTTKQGRGQARKPCYVAIFVCQTTKAIFLHQVLSVNADDCLIAILTCFLAKGVPRVIVSDGGKNLTRSEKDLRRMYENVQKLRTRVDQEMHQFPKITWHFTAPESHSQHGMAERYVGTVKNAMKKMSLKNPMKDLSDTELQFLLKRVESVLNSHPLSELTSNQDESNYLTPNHFSASGNSPLVLTVPGEELDKGGNQYVRKWYLIEEALREFWQLWWEEYAYSTRKIHPKWARGKAEVSPGDLVFVLDDEKFRTRLYYPVARVLSVHKDADEKIQTVTINFKGRTTRRGIRQLAPLPLS